VATVEEMIRKERTLLREANPNQWEDDDLIGFTDDAQSELYEDVMSLDQLYFSTSQLITLTTTQVDKEYPLDRRDAQILSVVNTEDADPDNQFEVNKVEYKDRLRFNDLDRYWLNGNKIGFTRDVLRVQRTLRNLVIVRQDLSGHLNRHWGSIFKNYLFDLFISPITTKLIPTPLYCAIDRLTTEISAIIPLMDKPY